MTVAQIPLEDQYKLAVLREDFRERITAAAISVSMQAFAGPPATGTAQTARLQLAHNIALRADFATDLFAWLVVSRPAFTSEDSLDDLTIVATIRQAFDLVAQQLLPPAGGP
jgi:hypothetical protein